MAKRIETLIINGDLFTMQGSGVGYIEKGAVAIDNGVILEVSSTEDLMEAYEAESIIDAKDKMVLPGFVDAHMHTSLNMFRGLAQDTKNWMMLAVNPIRTRLKNSDCKEAAKVNLLEAIASGTTTLGDYGVYEHLIQVDDFIHEIGARANLTPAITGWINRGETDDIWGLYDFSDEIAMKALDNNMILYNKWKKKSSRITVNMGAHAPDTLSRDMLIKCREVAIKNNMKINMHVAQGDRETNQIEKRYGMRSIPFLDSLNYLDENLIAVHLTEATDEEARSVAKKGVSMIVCSGSIGIIDGVVPPSYVFKQAGGNVALGSDQASGNNCNQIINEMKLTALFNKIKYQDPEVMQAWEVLRMATIEGAKAIGLGDRIGSIEKGKLADLTFIDLVTKTMMPVTKKPFRNHVPNLVYSARGNEVCRVMVEGKTIYLNGSFITTDENELISAFKTKSEDFFENTPWGAEAEQHISYRLQQEDKL